MYLKELLKQGKAGQIKVAVVALGLVFLALALTGRAPALFAIIGALMTQAIRFAPLLLRFAPSLKRHFNSSQSGAAGAAGSGTSQVSTATVVMSMQHTSGEIDGSVIAGPFESRQLSSLSIDELTQLYDYCQKNDSDACRLIAAYATRQRSDEWQDSANQRDETEHAQQRRPAASSSAIGLAEARQILGVDANADKQAIVAAHRSLMGKFHPDKGGNDYLATQLNTAREVLLEALGGK